MKGIYSNKKNSDGFTLIEVLVAIAILGFIAVSFLTMFTSGFLWISSAGDKGQAFSEGQQDVEGKLASGEALEFDDLELDFDGVADTVKIPGGLIESNQQVRTRESNLEAFTPFVPTVNLNPKVISEGRGQVTVNVTGDKTNFNSNTSVNVYDRHGSTIIYNNSQLNPVFIDDTTLSFTFPAGLTNAQGDYIVRIASTMTDGEVEIVRGKFVVEQPLLIAAGSSVYVSGDTSFWLEREGITPFPNFDEILDGTFGRSRYVLVGTNGKVLTSNSQQNWFGQTISGSDITGVVWSSFHEKYFAVSQDGKVFSSTNGTSWVSGFDVDDINSIELYAITSDLNGNLIVVGKEAEEGEEETPTTSNGVIYSSTDGSGWIKQSYSGTELSAVVAIFLSVTENRYIAVGESGAVAVTSDAYNWTGSLNNGFAGSVLRDIAFSSDRVLVVGENTVLASYDYGTNWSELASTNDFYGITRQGAEFFAVGTLGSIKKSTTGITWSDTGSSAPVAELFKTIVGK